MKKTVYFQFILSLTLLINSNCARNNKDSNISTTNINVSISNDPIKISSLFSDPQVVILEQGEFPLGKISKLKIYNDTIYVLSNLQIFIYDKNGSFIRIINKSGRGPGEYINTYDFFVDESGIIEVLDFRGKKIIKYDRNGNYLDEWKIGLYAFSHIKYEGNYIFFGGNGNKITEYGESMVYVFNKWKGHVIKEYIPINENMAKFLNYVDMRNIQAENNGFYLGFSPIDTVYYYNKGNLSPNILIDFGKRNINHQVYSQNFDDIMAFNNFLTEKDLCHYVYNYLISPPLILFNFLYKNDYWLCAYKTATGEVLSSTVIEDDLLFKGNTYRTQSFFPLEYENDTYYFMLQPYQITNYIKDSGVLNIGEINLPIENLVNLKIEDNPVIIKFKCKLN